MKIRIKQLLIILSKTLLGFVVFVLLYLGTAYVLSSIPINQELDNANEIAIYIKTNGVHTDIVVPVRNHIMLWDKQVQYQNVVSADSSYNYVGMGWGDKGFYLETPEWSDLKFSVAFKAAFALSTTAIHTTFYKNLQEDASCKKILISETQYKRLVHYIDKSFRKDSNGHFVHIKTNANYGNTDAFYEANGKYSLFKTCNTWANSALKSCGQRCCLWTAFDTGIFDKY